ncbi:MAG: type II toxin-antitoxin system prevent-host-death family antitoxin [Actinobacteria bacterium]|nr:type II toxin-antitoxin system prevent-host-death family antitoxin [Actinomycetota bacterium]
MEPARIGIRELREHLSRAIRRVTNGEMLEVTDRGRPVARIVPIGSLARLERLIAEGKLYPPRARGTRPAPLDVPSRMTSEEAVRILRGD